MLEWDRIYLTFENKCKTHRKSPANIRFKAAAKFTAGYFLLGRHRWPSDLKIILILSSPSTRPIVYGSGWEHKSLRFLPPHEHRKNYRRWQDITDKCFHAVSGMRKSVMCLKTLLWVTILFDIFYVFWSLSMCLAERSVSALKSIIKLNKLGSNEVIDPQLYE